MNLSLLPLAVGGDWVGGILLVVFLLVHLVNAVFGDKKKAPKKPAKPPRPAGGQLAQPEARKQQSGEIEQFLKRANDRRKQKEAAAPKPQQPGKKPSRRLVESPIEAEVVRRPSPSGEGVAAHVSQHLATSDFSTRAEHMTDDLTQADAIREQKWRKKFDHRVGKLADTSQGAAGDPAASAGGSNSAAPTSTTASPAAAGLMAMFRNPQTMRDAIVLGEILQRPSDRW